MRKVESRGLERQKSLIGYQFVNEATRAPRFFTQKVTRLLCLHLGRVGAERGFNSFIQGALGMGSWVESLSSDRTVCEN